MRPVFKIIIVYEVIFFIFWNFLYYSNPGVEAGAEIKGTGAVSTKWFAAKKNSSGTYELTAKGKRKMDSAISAVNSNGSSSSSC